MLTKNHLRRKSKNKFIHHAPDNTWTKCFVTKSTDKLIYEKIPSQKEKFIRVIAFDRNEKSFISNNLPLMVNGKIIGYISKSLILIYDAIEKSKYILDLKDNWDGEGAAEYDFEVWKKSILFLAKLSNKIYKSYGQIIRSPKIYHGPNGSIDIYWENELFNLLINIPKSGAGTFYGDNYGNNKSEGSFDPAMANVNIFPFLIEF